MSRNTVILNYENNYAAVIELCAEMKKYSDKVFIFTRTPVDPIDGIEIIVVDSAFNTQPKIRNYVNSYFRDRGFNGFLHVISNDVKLTADPSTFLSDIENAMTVLDYGIWFNTVCDGCNYVYSKYNSRMHINIDMPEVIEKTGLSGLIHFTSHSNAQWIIYDYSQTTDDQLRFDEDFTIPMFWIIEYLARRRNTKTTGQLYFMNQYMTVDSERGIFTNRSSLHNNADDPKIMQREDEIFKSKNINYAQDGNIDLILETFYKKLMEKANLPV